MVPARVSSSRRNPNRNARRSCPYRSLVDRVVSMMKRTWHEQLAFRSTPIFRVEQHSDKTQKRGPERYGHMIYRLRIDSDPVGMAWTIFRRKQSFDTEVRRV